MKITTMQIARFGVWEQLSLRVPNRRLAVLYGPNEAGKTTLLRFIRAVLYGVEPLAPGHRDGETPLAAWEGSLSVLFHGRELEIRRTSDRQTRGLVSVVGTDRQEPAETLLSEIVQRTDQSLFENVFAVGLDELQELATLQGEDVARQIYGMTLGPTGRKLLDAGATLDSGKRALLDADARSGRLLDVLEREQILSEDIAARQSLREEHADLCAQRGRIEDRIADLEEKKVEAERQLAAHRIVERVWPHWNQVRECRLEIESIPEITRFPANAIDRLARLEAEIEAGTQLRRPLVEEAKTLRSRLRDLSGRRAAHRHAPALAGFVEQAGWFSEVSRQTDAAHSRARQAQAELDRALESLPPHWTADRLEAADTGLAAHRRLISAADRYRAAARRRNRLARLHQRHNRQVRKRAADLDERLQGLGGTSLDDAIAQETKRLDGLQQLGRLRLRETELSARRRGLADLFKHARRRAELPQWVSLLLSLLMTVGFVATMIGVFRAAVKADVLAGTSMAFIGLTGLAVAWGFKRHQEYHAHGGLSRERAELERVDGQLREARAAIARLKPGSRADTLLSPHAAWMPRIAGWAAKAAADAGTEPLEVAADRLAELKAWHATRQRIQSRRRRLSELRSRFLEVQRNLSGERQSWCSLLKELGLEETVKVNDALEAWHRVGEARELLRASKSAANEHAHLERSTQSFVGRVREAARHCGHASAETAHPLELLAGWDAELKALGLVQEEHRRTRREWKDRAKKAEHAQRRIRRRKNRVATLFAKGGASNRAEFVERAGWVARRRECEELLEIAGQELREAAAAEPELAIVEDDFERFDPADNRERIESLNAELAQIDRDLQAAFEERGSVRHSLTTIEAGLDASQLMFDYAQTRHELHESAAEWFGLELARQAVDRVRSKFERTCQPAVLALASKYLERLTRGRYANVWTPLGRRELRIDDEHGGTLTVEQLSGGTREQLFLAVRMAMIRELAQKGIELPMILDDVLVNFDQLRTEAAVETLLEFSEENQQILFFTCHLHLAHMFETRGVEPIWLPGHDFPQHERRAG